MFADCHKLEFLNLSNWNISKTNIMYEIFKNCHSLKEIDLTNF